MSTLQQRVTALHVAREIMNTKSAFTSSPPTVVDLITVANWVLMADETETFTIETLDGQRFEYSVAEQEGAPDD